jgi:hypothetical protein
MSKCHTHDGKKVIFLLIKAHFKLFQLLGFTQLQSSIKELTKSI